MDDSNFTLMTLADGEVLQCSVCSAKIKGPDDAFLVVDDGEVTDTYCQPCLAKAESEDEDED